MSGETLILMLPTSADVDPATWHVRNGELLDGARLSGLLAQAELPEFDKIIALAPMTVARVEWTVLSDLEPRQAETVARLKMQERSVGEVHAVANAEADGAIVAAVISTAMLSQSLVRLQVLGLDPDHVVPAALILDPPSKGLARAEIGGDALLRGTKLAAPDEPALSPLLAAGSSIIAIEGEAVDDAILNLAMAGPPLDFRQGAFAKRKQRLVLSEKMRRVLILLTGALLLTTLVLTLAVWAKYEDAKAREDERALAAARKIDPSITDIDTAEERIDRALRETGRGQGSFAPVSAIIWRSVKDTPNVALTDLRYDESGIVTTTLSAPEAGSVNQTLLAIQRAGFRITATPRTDGSGATMVDLTVRLP